MPMQKKGLGRGLSALIPSAAEPKIEARSEQAPFEIAVDRITPSPFQPRRAFDEAGTVEHMIKAGSQSGSIDTKAVRAVSLWIDVNQQGSFRLEG